MIMAQSHGGGPAPSIPDNEVWYYAPAQVTLYTSTGVVSHTFSDGKGVLTFASTVTTINTWLRGTAITKCRMPESTTTLAANAFNSCSSLTDINLPESISVINGSAFTGCSSLVIPDLNLPNLTSIAAETFCGYGQSFAQIPHILSVSNLGRITSLPGNSVYGVFFKQEALTSVVLPSTLTSIGQNSFNGCISLTTINLPTSTPPTLASNVFTNTPIASLAADAAIYVPDEVVDDYKVASGWSTYATIIKPLSEKPA